MLLLIWWLAGLGLSLTFYGFSLTLGLNFLTYSLILYFLTR